MQMKLNKILNQSYCHEKHGLYPKLSTEISFFAPDAATWLAMVEIAKWREKKKIAKSFNYGHIDSEWKQVWNSSLISRNWRKFSATKLPPKKNKTKKMSSV